MRSFLLRVSMPLAAALVWGGASGAAAQQSAPDNTDAEFERSQIRLDLALGSGARALGMGGAFLARADDASAASWNPAGLSYLRRPEFTTAGILTRANSEGIRFPTVSDPEHAGVVDRSFELRAENFDIVAAAYPFEIGSLSGAAQLSFQRVIPIRASRDIVNGRNVIHLTTQGGFDVLAASAGIQVRRSLRIGTTVNRWLNGYASQYRRFEPDRTDNNSELSIRGWNANVGLIWTPLSSLNLGIVGKTPFTAGATMKRSKTDYPANGSVLVFDAPPRNDVKVHLPGSVGLGASWRIASPLTVSFDVTETLWSDAWILNYFDVLRAGGVQVFPQELRFPLVDAPKQKDTRQIRLGMEYVFFLRSLKLPVRAGYFNDRQYFQTTRPVFDPHLLLDESGSNAAPPLTPHFHALTAGVGVSKGDVLFDLAYVEERGHYVDSPNATTFLSNSTTSRRLFASLIFRPGSSH